MRSPAWMTSPTATLTLLTVPPTSARTGISIFIDSSSTTMSPLPISSPSLTTTSSTLATISARTSSAIFTPLVPAISHAGCWFFKLWSGSCISNHTTGPDTGYVGPVWAVTAASGPRERLDGNLTGAEHLHPSEDGGFHHGQAWPQKERPQVQQGQPRQAAQLL